MNSAREQYRGLYKEGQGRSPPELLTLAAPLLLLPLQLLGEALQKFSTTTNTTPSCCWDSRRIYYIRCPLERGEDRLHQHRTCDRVRKRCPFVALE